MKVWNVCYNNHFPWDSNAQCFLLSSSMFAPLANRLKYRCIIFPHSDEIAYIVTFIFNLEFFSSQREKKVIVHYERKRFKLVIYNNLLYFCKLCCRNHQECQKIFKAREPIDRSVIAQKLTGYGVGTIDGIDPNPDNYVSAAIIHTRTLQIGCLLRLEPNRQAEVGDTHIC